MRAAKTVEEADAVNTQGLSNAARLYQLGAVAFAGHDPRARVFPAGAEAAGRRTGRLGLRAQYSLGRVLMNDHGTPMNESGEAAPALEHPPKAELEQALAAFQQVIDRVKSGAADPDRWR